MMCQAVLVLAAVAVGETYPREPPRATSLTNLAVEYTVPDQRFVLLKRGDVTAIVVDNAAVDVPELRGHRAGYNGIASLSHRQQPRNLFVGSYAGLNFEHIHDGTLAVEREKFEPRVAPMELRRIDEHTVELYQPSTPNWKLESCGRYHLLPDGTIEYTFECIPRADVFRNGYIGLFWASYIDGPEDRAISFRGHEVGRPQDVGWVRSVSPRHGTDATHPPAGTLPKLTIDPEFPLRLVSGRSSYRHTEPWYYGVGRGMALVHSFRDGDGIWFAQSPTGGGADNPAWDFQWFIPDYEVGRAYGFRMRMAYVAFESREQIAALARRHVRELNQK